MLDPIRRLHAHRRWANARLMAVVRTLSDQQRRRAFDIGRGSVHDGVVHLYAAELIWLEALTGNPRPPKPDEVTFQTLDELEAAWAMLDHRWDRYLDSLTVADLDVAVTKASTSGDTLGRALPTPARDILLHVCTHAQYTAAQVVNMLRRLGVPADQLPETQLITMSRQATSAWPPAPPRR